MQPPFHLVSLTFFLSTSLLCFTAQAQETAAPQPSQPVSPAGLPAVPDIAVPWPDLDAFPPPEERPGRRRFGQPLRYTVAIEGLDSLGLEDRFRDLSTLIAENKGEALPSQINRRARTDAQTVTRLLESIGYYAPNVDTAIARRPDETDRATVTLTVTPGPRYTFSDIRLRFPRDTAAASRTAIREMFPLFPGDLIVAADVETAEAQLRLKLPQRGYPFPEFGARQIVLDDLEHNGTYTLPVTPGPLSVFGGYRMTGDRLFDETHLDVLARFKPGDPYDARDVEDLRQALVATGLFSRVALRPVLTGEHNADGEAVVDMEVDTGAGPQRRLAARGGYGTGEGFKVEGEWLHRNLFPPEGALSVRATAGTKDQGLTAELRRSNAGKRDRSLFVLAEAVQEERDAYNAYALRLAAGLQREPDVALERRWGYSVGTELVATNQRDRSLFAEEGDENGRRRTFFILATPLQVKYDGSNNLLNPTRGFRVAVQGTPEAAYQDGFFGYTRLRLDASGYQPLKGEDLVLAGRIALGSILGASRDRIAPSRRFYSGGGGSVRGFGFEELGPQDADGDPLGGRSLAEASAELRYRFGDYGIVAFVDAGQVYTDTLPTFSDLRYGAGIGARYYTAFGPIRFDVATPLNRREGDPKVAVYISIGQAF